MSTRRMLTEPLPEDEEPVAIIIRKAYTCFGVLLVISMGLLGLAALGLILIRN